MATVLYKKGKSHTINGVECDCLRAEALEVDAALKDGWSFYLPGKEPIKSEKKATTKKSK